MPAISPRYLALCCAVAGLAGAAFWALRRRGPSEEVKNSGAQFFHPDKVEAAMKKFRFSEHQRQSPGLFIKEFRRGGQPLKMRRLRLHGLDWRREIGTESGRRYENNFHRDEMEFRFEVRDRGQADGWCDCTMKMSRDVFTEEARNKPPRLDLVDCPGITSRAVMPTTQIPYGLAKLLKLIP